MDHENLIELESSYDVWIILCCWRIEMNFLLQKYSVIRNILKKKKKVRSLHDLRKIGKSKLKSLIYTTGNQSSASKKNSFNKNISRQFSFKKYRA